MTLATVQAFIDTYGEREAVDLTNIDDADVQSINVSTLQTALNDAQSQLEAFVSFEHPLFARWQMATARYFLDVHLRRAEVAQDYENSLKAAQSYRLVRLRAGSRTLPPRSLDL